MNESWGGRRLRNRDVRDECKRWGVILPDFSCEHYTQFAMYFLGKWIWEKCSYNVPENKICNFLLVFATILDYLALLQLERTESLEYPVMSHYEIDSERAMNSGTLECIECTVILSLHHYWICGFSCERWYYKKKMGWGIRRNSSAGPVDDYVILPFVLAVRMW